MVMEYEMEKEKFSKDNYKFFSVVGKVSPIKSELAICATKEKKTFHIVIRSVFDSKEVSDISDKINELLHVAKRDYDIEVNRCCISASGPVSRKRGYIKLTNLDLEINSHNIMSKTLLNKVILINDYEAYGYGLNLIDFDNDVILLNHKEDDLMSTWTSENVYSLIGYDVGLGVSILYYDQKKHLHIPLPSEGGHIDFSARDKFDLDFITYLNESEINGESSIVEYETILSQQGFLQLFDFVVKSEKFDISDLDKEIVELDSSEKIKKILSNYENDEICKFVVSKFSNYFGRFARIIALISESYSGMFIHFKLGLDYPEILQNGEFISEFEAHNKKNDVLKKIPVYLINKKDLAIYGCCNVASNFFNLS